MEIAQRYPRAVDDGGKLDVEIDLPARREESFPPASTARHFHGAPRFSCVGSSCGFPLLTEAKEQLALGGLHELRRFGITVGLDPPVQAWEAPGGLQITGWSFR